jgi:hypothetical protein
MRLCFTIVIMAVASMLTACATRKPASVEVTPAVLWISNDDRGRHESTNHYAPCVIAQGIPFKIDCSQLDSFTSPDTQKDEKFFDGVLVHLTVTVSNATACFAGRVDYQLHLGVTSSYTEDDESLSGQTLRTYSIRFSGTSTLGHQIRIGAGEDINNEPSICLMFRRTSAPISKFTGEILGDR